MNQFADMDIEFIEVVIDRSIPDEPQIIYIFTDNGEDNV